MKTANNVRKVCAIYCMRMVKNEREREKEIDRETERKTERELSRYTL